MGLKWIFNENKMAPIAIEIRMRARGKEIIIVSSITFF
jgi:hypothetical protein